jgi:4-hydroxyphenylpyruvate dioxygenase
MSDTTLSDDDSGKRDFLGLKGIDYVELYVGNARQAAHFFRTSLGLTPTAYCGPETGSADKVSYILERRQIKLVLTSGINAGNHIVQRVAKHGDGVKDISFSVDDAAHAFREAIRRGGRPIQELNAIEDENGRFAKTTIAAYGDTVHSFIERKNYHSSFLPGFRPIENPPASIPTGLAAIDHIAVGVDGGTLEEWVDFYQHVMGFHISHEEDVATEYSGMNSKVVQNSAGPIRFSLMEPTHGKRRSQIQEFLNYYYGPGVQHIAFLSNNIISTVRMLRENGMEFLSIPAAYYDALEERISEIEEDIDELRYFNILADRDDWGYLMQTFSKPVEARPTIFIEVIQRKGSLGFGSGNIKALFEAVEREQEVRSNADPKH